MQWKVELASEAAQSESMKGLYQKTIGDVFIIRYYATTDNDEDSSLSFAEDAITNKMHGGVLDETLGQNVQRRSRPGTPAEALILKIVNNPGFSASVAASMKLCEADAIKDDLNAEIKWANEIPLPLHRSLYAIAGLTFDKEFKARHSRRK